MILDYNKKNVWHVTPINDLKDHQDSMECWCNPKIQIMENGGVVVTHNALDMREYAEKE